MVSFNKLLEKFTDLVTADNVTETPVLDKFTDAVLGGEVTEGDEGYTYFFDINTGGLIEKFPYGENLVVGIDIQEYTNLKIEANKKYSMPSLEGAKDENKEHFIYNYIINNSNTLYQTEYSYSEFMDIAGTLYAESSLEAGNWKENAAIYNVLENRKKAIYKTKGIKHSIIEIIKETGVYGWDAREKIKSKFASNKAKLNAQKGLLTALKDDYDYSNGGYYWHGVDFAKHTEGSKAYENFYLKGFRFTDASHDIWGLGNKINHGSHTIYIDNKPVVKEWDYQYESTAVYGKTTFMRLTEEYKIAQFNDAYENHIPY